MAFISCNLSVYIASYAELHHQCLNNPHKDPNYKENINNKLGGKHCSSKNTLKYILSMTSPINAIIYTKNLIKNRI